MTQVFCGGDFRSCMALEADFRFFAGHAAAVVYNLYQGSAGVLHYKGDVVCTCIQGIFHQLLNYRGGALNHLAGSYHVGYVGR